MIYPTGICSRPALGKMPAFIAVSRLILVVKNQFPLPLKLGVAPSYLWIPEGINMALLDFLCQQFPDISAGQWLQRIARQEVSDQAGHRLQAGDTVKRGMCIYYYRELEHEPEIPFQEQIIYEDPHLLVADKPHFLPVTPAGQYLRETLLSRLRHRTGIAELSPLHRLDRETAGLVLFSKQASQRAAYQALFRDEAIAKTYHAIAADLSQLDFPIIRQSRLESADEFFLTREVAGPPNSTTLITKLHSQQAWALYELKPSTGKKHQLRVHMAALGAPLLNDSFYPVAQAANSCDFSKPLQLLAKTLSFQDPVTGARHEFSSLQSLTLPPAD